MASGGEKKKRRLPAWMTILNQECRSSTEKENDEDNSKQMKMELNKNAKELQFQSKSVCCMSASDAITASMKFVSFPGKIIYCDTFSDCACYCEELLMGVRKSERKVPVGFDMEWPVTFIKGSSEKTALIQMCFPEEKCFLFHLSAIGKFPKSLGSLILNEKLILIGLNIETDLWKLERDFDVSVKCIFDRESAVDVAKLANKRLKSCERWDLNGLCTNVLRQRLNKDPNVRCGAWTDIPLNQRQIDYAVADAYAGLKIYQALISGSSTEPKTSSKTAVL